MRAFISIDPQIFFKGSRAEDPRLGDAARVVAPSELEELTPGIVIAGYPDDEGIRLNRGRPGAKDAPDELRRQFYRATLLKKQDSPRFYDIGNLHGDEMSLGQRHETAKVMAEKALSAGHRWLSLGGGHDYGYPDVAAFLNHCERQKRRGLILHFDAHLDCRPDDEGFNSGTPFYRILRDYPRGSYDIIAIGLQPVCNSGAYLAWARERKMRIFFADEWRKSTATLRRHLRRGRPVFVSLDMDVFATPYAPGTSNNWPMGLTPRELQPVFNDIRQRADVLGLGVYEVSPPLDVAGATVKLAAQIMADFARHWMTQGARRK